jgi:hypothetical protein
MYQESPILIVVRWGRALGSMLQLANRNIFYLEYADAEHAVPYTDFAENNPILF